MSTYGITYEGVRVGAIWRIAGNPPAERWVAFSLHRPPHDENKRGFPTRKAASEWLVEEHKAKGPKDG
jgi:hypothetical protein